MTAPTSILDGAGRVIDTIFAPNGTGYTKAGGRVVPSTTGLDSSVSHLVDVPNYAYPPFPVTLANAAGTLGAGTYYYVVTAVTPLGETTPSAEVSITILATTGVLVSWPQVAGATGYKVYGRATGAETLLFAVTSGATLSWHDDGSLSPSGALPTVNTARIVHDVSAAALGQAAMAASLPVAIASNQSAVPVTYAALLTAIQALGPTPTIFKAFSGTVITSETTIWTPTSGKKFQLQGYVITQGVVTGDVTLKDNTAGTTILVIPAHTIGIAQLSPNLGQGITSAAANNVLTAKGASTETISGYVFGNEV